VPRLFCSREVRPKILTHAHTVLVRAKDTVYRIVRVQYVRPASFTSCLSPLSALNEMIMKTGVLAIGGTLLQYSSVQSRGPHLTTFICPRSPNSRVKLVCSVLFSFCGIPVCGDIRKFKHQLKACCAGHPISHEQGGPSLEQCLHQRRRALATHPSLFPSTSVG
jgi:hypothetical protein